VRTSHANSDSLTGWGKNWGTDWGGIDHSPQVPVCEDLTMPGH
jgi:hypothetical protein